MKRYILLLAIPFAYLWAAAFVWHEFGGYDKWYSFPLWLTLLIIGWFITALCGAVYFDSKGKK